MSLEDDVLRELRPSAQIVERVDSAVRQLRLSTERAIASTGMDIQTMLVGSVAKGTYVGEPDIDLFMLFPEDVEREKLEKVGLSVGQKVLGGEKRYAEHPYTHGNFMGFEVDLVPCYAVKDGGSLRSAVDRTPFHTRYVISRLTDDQRGQVLLLKQFLKGVGTYGAEAKVQGFSGYLTELLVLKYGDFLGVLRAAIGWRPGLVLRMDEGKKTSGEATLTFIDPVDPKRNVASALSLDRFCLFQQACREYLRSPDRRYFFPRKRSLMSIAEIRNALKTRGTVILVLALDRPDLVDDNLYPQAYRSLTGLRKLLEGYEFKVLDAALSVEKDVRMVFELDRGELPEGRLHQGPPAWTSNAEDFLLKWRAEGLGQPYISDGRWFVYAKREFRRPEELLKVKGKEAALGNDFRGLKGLRCWSGARALTVENRPSLTKLLDKRENWRV